MVGGIDEVIAKTETLISNSNLKGDSHGDYAMMMS